MKPSHRLPDWNHLRAFLATAESGSLSAAARELGQTQPTLSRQVTALEEELGVMLFERVGRALELTTTGIELLEHVRKMGEAAHHVSLVASGQSQTIAGDIRITASDVFSAHLLPPVLHRLREEAPELNIDIVAANDIQDLMRREADIAIRHVRPEQPDLIAKLIGEPKAHFYAHASYLQKHGRPQTVEELSNLDFISYGNPKEMIEFMTPLGLSLTLDNFRVGSSNGLVAWQYCCEGLGVSVMGESIASKTPNMEQIMPELPAVQFPMWLVTHRELNTSRRIRLVFDLLADYLKKSVS